MNGHDLRRTDWTGHVYSPLKDGRDGRFSCPSCRNLNTEQVVDAVLLRPFQEYHHKPCVVAHCWLCNAVWHWAKDAVEPEHFATFEAVRLHEQAS